MVEHVIVCVSTHTVVSRNIQNILYEHNACSRMHFLFSDFAPDQFSILEERNTKIPLRNHIYPALSHFYCLSINFVGKLVFILAKLKFTNIIGPVGAQTFDEF